jgi:hypothetical protein
MDLYVLNTQVLKRKRDQYCAEEDGASKAKKMKTTDEASSRFGCLQDIGRTSTRDLYVLSTQVLKRKRDQYCAEEDGAPKAKKMRTIYCI